MNISIDGLRSVMSYMTLQQVGDVWQEASSELLARGVPLCSTILAQREAIDRVERFRLAIATRAQADSLNLPAS